MIHISTLASGALLIQRDAFDIQIDASAIRGTLGLIIVALVDSGQALAHARRAGHASGYEEGLAQGHINERIERDASERIADRQRAELEIALATVGMATAA